MTALSFLLPGTEWGGGWDLYTIYIQTMWGFFFNQVLYQIWLLKIFLWLALLMI